MSNSPEDYSYRAGQKIDLVERADQFIVRSLFFSLLLALTAKRYI